MKSLSVRHLYTLPQVGTVSFIKIPALITPKSSHESNELILAH